MLIQVDAKGLEWCVAAYLSQDKVALRELHEGTIDVHSDNQQRLGLPERLVAKVFLFRLIYGGSAYSYAADPDFNYISNDQQYWQSAIDAFYAKYTGLAGWHARIVADVMKCGYYEAPTGRRYYYQPNDRTQEWPRTQILNYPVQGLGADLMTLARVSLYRRMRGLGLTSLLIGTVHDSVLVDSPTSEVAQLVSLIQQVWRDIPANFRKMFGTDYNVPCRCEIQVGPNWKEMKNVD